MINVSAYGKIVTDIESGRTTTGSSVVRFRMMCRNPLKANQSANLFIGVAAFGKAGDLLRRLKKGDRVYVSGRLSITEYTAGSGEKRSSTEIIVDSVGYIDWPDGVPQDDHAADSRKGFEEEPDPFA